MEMRAPDRLVVTVLLVASLAGLPPGCWTLDRGHGKARPQHEARHAHGEEAIAACAPKRIWANLNDGNGTVSLTGQPVEVAPTHQTHQGYICAHEGHRCRGMRPALQTMCQTQYTYSNLLARPKLSGKQGGEQFAPTLVRVPAHCGCVLLRH